jgi:hypothetical protein
MNFNIPGLKEGEDPNKHREIIKEALQKATGWTLTNRKIFSLIYSHEGKEYSVAVGNKHPRSNEPVMLIYEFVESGGGYLICTPNRGFRTPNPMIVGNNDVVSVKDF